MTPNDRATDLSPARIAAAVERIDPVFLHTPQFISDDLSAALGREVVIKNETSTPIGSFKGRGTSWRCGAPATARSFAAGRVVATHETNTIATALAIAEPIAESLARVTALVDEIVLVDDDDLRSAQQLVLDTVNVSAEPAGAAGVAALVRHGPSMPPGPTAILLTGAGARTT